MKKVLISILSISLLVCALTGVSYGWQGKMAGMGDPYGLVQDESDFLIHPAKIAAGEGVRFYGDYRFTYTDVTDWDYELDAFDTAGTPLTNFHYDTSGDEGLHETLVGTGFPLGAGRMGAFLSYDDMRGDYDGNEENHWTSNYAAHDLRSDFDDFALRLLYGLPLGGFNLGGEVQFAYRNEENKNGVSTSAAAEYLNYILSLASPESNLLPFQSPYDSSYWEGLLKASLEGTIGPADVQCTLRGGVIFAGDNRLKMERTADSTFVDMEGAVEGWRTGGDLWVGYPLGDGLSLPFLVRIDYRDTTRDANGPGQGGWSSWTNLNYETEAKDLHLVVGGGVDKELGAGTRIASGIYYNYLQGKNEINFHAPWSEEYFDNSDCPSQTEHQIMVRFAGEHELSPRVALRAGIDLFYGWVGEEFNYTYTNPGDSSTDDISLDGHHRGIGASVGGTVTFDSFTLEPFLNAGWQDLKLDGDGTRIANTGTTTALWKMDTSRSEWYVGGGFSVLFDL